MKKSRSKETAETLARAERAIRRRQANGLQFRSVKTALSWYFTMGPRMQSAKSPSRAFDRAPDGSMVRREGGGGQDVDDVLATLLTIRDGLDALGRFNARRQRILLMARKDGMGQVEIAKELHCSQNHVSTEVGKAEDYLAGYFGASGDLLG